MTGRVRSTPVSRIGRSRTAGYVETGHSKANLDRPHQSEAALPLMAHGRCRAFPGWCCALYRLTKQITAPISMTTRPRYNSASANRQIPRTSWSSRASTSRARDKTPLRSNTSQPRDSAGRWGRWPRPAVQVRREHDHRRRDDGRYVLDREGQDCAERAHRQLAHGEIFSQPAADWIDRRQ